MPTYTIYQITDNTNVSMLDIPQSRYKTNGANTKQS